MKNVFVFVAVVAMIFVAILPMRVLAAESASWGEVKSDRVAIGKLVISATTAGGWRGANYQPSVDRGPINMSLGRGENPSTSVTATNPADNFSGVDAKIIYSQNVFKYRDIVAEHAAHISTHKGDGVVTVEIKKFPSVGSNPQFVHLFWLNMTVYQDAPIGSSIITVELIFYDEHDVVIGTQTVRWIFNII